MKKSVLLLICSIVLIFSSCSKETQTASAGAYDNGILILNEGGFMSGNASLDYYSYTNDSLIKNVFKSVNGISLGDVAQDIKLINGNIAIVINNSNKIYWLTKDSLKLKFTTSNIMAPRYIESISTTQALVTSMNGSIYVVNSTTGNIEKTISTQQFTEKIIINNNDIYLEFKKSYTSALPDTQGFLVLDKSTLNLKSRILTSFVPEASQWMNGKIYSFYTDPKYTDATQFKSYNVSSGTFTNFSCNLLGRSLIYPYNNTLYYYDNKEIKKIDASDNISTVVSGINATYPYALGVSNRGDILFGDAKNFSSPSTTYIYSNSGTLKKTLTTDIATAAFY